MLATEILVTVSGHRVTILETSKDQPEFGAGLQSSPNGTEIYHLWGLDDILKPVATAPRILEIRNFDAVTLAR